jgi:hypothetical protein
MRLNNYNPDCDWCSECYRHGHTDENCNANQKKTMKDEDLEKLYATFTTTVDLLTVQVQLDRVTNSAMEILKKRHGQIIPKQTNRELLDLYTEILAD